ncbi:ATP-binding protein [Gandjariella thermophila]|uniref:histidine kinase n=1 Tax=Gandjariella thermophila TaxID=1931992 RepID=A0A4D4JFN0_9PSEU|nr:sensor histidine kinase [Gandjariella thermophila]GDY32683.1 histidine kinase [Gandjariella thermophila]
MRTKKLSTQITISQLTILVCTVAIGFALFAGEERHQLDRQYQGEALAIAQTVAGVPEIRAAMEYGDAGDLVQMVAERIRRNSQAAYVVVIDRDGVRHSHPNPALVGQPITEPVEALDGHTHVGIDPGSLGASANGKAPLYGPTGDLVGEVSVGILETRVTGHLLAELPSFALYTALALAVGVAASLLLARQLKRSTFGLELPEIAALLQEREAMLHGIREGVITLDPDGRLTLANDEARRLLPTRDLQLGVPLVDVVPPGRLRDVLSGAIGGTDRVVLTGDHCLVVNRTPVSVAGRDLGAVITLRDRTEMEDLVRELDSARGLTDALRAQQHEVANRMHTLAGLLELGDREQALRYLTETEGLAAERADAIRERIGHPLVVALLLAKTTVAAERGVDLVLTEESWLTETCPHARELITVLGNLVDNAVDAAAAGPPPARVTVDLEEGPDDVLVRVRDTGTGIPPDAAAHIFDDGFSTKPADGHRHRGLGLALVHRLTRRRGGSITVSEGPGATFTVRLPQSQRAASTPQRTGAPS